jgi:mono/diheme cytochrome c family protein
MKGSIEPPMPLGRLWRWLALAGVIFALAVVCATASAQEARAAQDGRVGSAVEDRASGKPVPTPAERAQIQYGREIAVAQCSSCHALDNNAKSPNPEAPPLRSALWRFEENGLANHFIEALQVGHGDMPLFDFTPIGADALIAYLKSIKTPRDIDEK